MSPEQRPARTSFDGTRTAWHIQRARPGQALARRLLAIEYACSHSFLFVGLSRVAWRPLPSLASYRKALSEERVWVGGLAPSDPSNGHSSQRLGPLGFCLATGSGQDLHIDEIDVLPSWQNQGLASALLQHLADEARAQGLRRLTLTTFVDVPWNAPFYARRGFVRIAPDAGNPSVAREWQRLIDKGIDARSRCAMALDLTP